MCKLMCKEFFHDKESGNTRSFVCIIACLYFYKLKNINLIFMYHIFKTLEY